MLKIYLSNSTTMRREKNYIMPMSRMVRIIGFSNEDVYYRQYYMKDGPMKTLGYYCGKIYYLSHARCRLS